MTATLNPPESTLQGFADTARLDGLIANDPISALRALSSSYAQAELSFSSRRVFRLAGTYQVANEMRDDPQLRERFFQSDFFEKLRKPSPRKVLLYCLMALVGARKTHDNAYESARYYRKKLQKLFDQEASVDDAITHLEGKGAKLHHRAALRAEPTEHHHQDRSNPPRPQPSIVGQDIRTSRHFSQTDDDEELKSLFELCRACFAHRRGFRDQIVFLRLGRDTSNRLLGIRPGQQATLIVETRDGLEGWNFIDLIGLSVDVD